MAKGAQDEFFGKIPSLNEELKAKFADKALEFAMIEARNHPPQMQDLIIGWNVGGLINTKVALMVMDILYLNGTLTPLTENEKATSNLIMFSDKLPE